MQNEQQKGPFLRAEILYPLFPLTVREIHAGCWNFPKNR